MTIAALALLAALVLPPPPGTPTVPRVSVTAHSAWSVPLPAKLSGPVRHVPRVGDEPVVLVPLEDAIELRRVKDGSVVWRREAAGSGLQTGEPGESLAGPVLGWTGHREDQPVLHVFALADGGTVLEAPLVGEPVGPPLAAPSTQPGESRWFVPLDGGRVQQIEPDGRPARTLALPRDEVVAPLATVAGFSCVAAGTPRRLVSIRFPERRTGVRGFDPATLAAHERYVFAASGRRFEAWRCRANPARGIRCHGEWRQQLGGIVTSPPATHEDIVLVPSLDTFLYAFLARNGHLAWRAFAGHRLSSTPLVWDDVVAVLPESTATVKFFQLADGRPAGQLDGDPAEVFTFGIARSGGHLLVTAVRAPSEIPVLRAFTLDLRRAEPGAADAPVPADATPATSPEPRTPPTSAAPR
ncbi:MAG: PQQ-binding-like beta-propeller repeat protein [Acidobacteria bacterium]|nr:PQQ-binding-like beta-propeller repeat protein [Acidobacteriota bacterium]